MSDEMEGRLRQLSQEIAGSAPTAHGWSTVEERADRDVVDARRSRGLVASAGVAIVVLGIGALMAISSLDDDPAVDAPSAPTATIGSASTTSLSTMTTMAPAVVPVPYVALVDGAPVGDTWVTGLATTADQLSALWSDLGLNDPLPTLDFERQVVVYFGPAESSSCPLLPLDQVSYSSSTNRLYPELRFEGGHDCNADANPHAVIVAVDRAALPAAPFDIWVSNDDPPECCADNMTTVMPTDVTTTGSTLPPPTSTIDRAVAEVAIAAARTAPPIVIASDDTILASGEMWEFRVRVAHTAQVTAVCTENVGTVEACHVLPFEPDGSVNLGPDEGPTILVYGGAPTPVVGAWSRTPFTEIVALLSDGQSNTALGVNTDAGTFAAIPFSATNPPVSLIARTTQGDIDLHLADYVGANGD